MASRVTQQKIPVTGVEDPSGIGAYVWQVFQTAEKCQILSHWKWS